MHADPITATMLYDYVKCPHRVGLDLFSDPAKRDRVSSFVELLWERGHVFEKEVIDKLEIPYINLREAPDDGRQKLTFKAMSNRETLIYGGRISSEDLLGEPDLLRLEGSGYVAGDIKSGAGLEGGAEDSDRKPKKHYAVQLGFYMDILERSGQRGDAPPFVWDIHGDEVPYQMSEPRSSRSPGTMWDEYQATLDAVRSIVSQQVTTSPALASICKLCHWRIHCLKVLENLDDLTLIPDLGRSRREKLQAHLSTVSELADLDLSTVIHGKKCMISGIGPGMLDRYQARAKLQKQPGAQPYFIEEIKLPSDRLELFFDVETDPLRDICYLHGFVERMNSDPSSEKYVYYFAEKPTPEAERVAFMQAWEYVQERQPSALYFYSHYEKTIWNTLATRFPDVASDSDVTALFDSAIAVDLFHGLVRSKMEWPTRDLSIKTIASFLGFRWRDPEPSGAESVKWYHKWVETDDKAIRQRILEYNEDDCLAMRILVDAVRNLGQGNK